MSARGSLAVERQTPRGSRHHRRRVPPRGLQVRTAEEPLFERLGEVNEPLPQRSFRRWERHHQLPGLVTPVVAAVLSGVALWIAISFWVWPSATVQISPLATHVPVTLEVLVDPSLQSVSLDTRAIPGIVAEAISDGEMAMPTTGRRREPEDFASGRITLRNRTREVLVVPRNTRVGTQVGTAFLTDAEVLVPPTVEIAGRTVPGDATVGITAEEPGTSGNVQALSIGTVEGPLGPVLEVFNANALAGASEREVALVSQRDIDELEQVLLERLQSAAVEQLRRERPEQQSLVVWSPEAGNPEVVRREFSAEINQTAAVLNLEMGVLARATVFSNEDLEQVIARELEAGGANVEFDAIRIVSTVVLDESFGHMKLRVEAVGESVERLDTDSIRGALAGVQLDDGVLTLDDWPQIAKWQVVHDPPDTDNFPRWSWRIDVQITAPTSIPAG